MNLYLIIYHHSQAFEISTGHKTVIIEASTDAEAQTIADQIQLGVGGEKRIYRIGTEV